MAVPPFRLQKWTQAADYSFRATIHRIRSEYPGPLRSTAGPEGSNRNISPLGRVSAWCTCWRSCRHPMIEIVPSRIPLNRCEEAPTSTQPSPFDRGRGPAPALVKSAWRRNTGVCERTHWESQRKRRNQQSCWTRVRFHFCNPALDAVRIPKCDRRMQAFTSDCLEGQLEI